MVVFGFLWGLQFPVIKKIWTSSYVLVAGGYSAILLGFFYVIIEIFQIQRWAQVFIWIGANAITLYMVHNMVDLPKLASRLVGGHVRDYLDLHLARGFGEVAIAATVIAFTIVLARFLYKRKIFLRI